MTKMDTDNVVSVGEGIKEEEDPYPFDIYISARINDDFVCRWFVINNHTKPIEFLSPVISDLQPNFKFASNGACVVALGSWIYVIGGYDRSDRKHDEDDEDGNLIPFDPRTNEVYRIDTLHPDQWMWCPPMAKKRSGARACTHDGKIYVVGGFNLPVLYRMRDLPNAWDDNGPFDDFSFLCGRADSVRTDDYLVETYSIDDDRYIEVLDPEEGKWKPAFPSIPNDYLKQHYIDACYVRDKPSGGGGGGGAIEFFVRIVGISSTQKLYRYDSDDQSWTLYANDFGPYKCGSLVFADDILYSYNNYPAWEAKRTKASKVAEGSILCFNVNKPEAEPKKLKGLEDLLPKSTHFGYYPVATLRHLGCGTKFCLIWEEELYLALENAITPDRVPGPCGRASIAVHCLKFTVSKVSLEKQGEFDFYATQPSKSTNFMEAEEVVNITAIPRGAKCVEEGIWGSSDNSIRIKRVKTSDNSIRIKRVKTV